MELLAPAGNYKAFLGAVNAGADAVYLGGSKFGARAFADNFTDEEIIKAIKYAHAFKVKVYLTVNTLIKEKEFSDAIEYIKPFYEAGLDACIVQDLGLISVFNKYFPDMDLHISTQGFATGFESVKFYKEMGAKRVVLARELNLDEIKYIKNNLDIELETFIHGAMCYSYSGECLFSSCLGLRSGNRGRCAGPCRLPYKYSGLKDVNLQERESYFLSMKDQCAINLIPELIEAKIDSLKIEGRMKKPEYTAFVTHIYRKYIDLYKENPKDFKVSKEDLEALKHIYLRSEIGEGYYKTINSKDMITLKSPAYSGNDENLMVKIRRDFLDTNKKLNISIFASAFKNQRLYLSFSYEDKFVDTESDILLEKAINNPTAKESIYKSVTKLGDTVFCASEVNIETDGECFVPVKVINECRRNLALKLFDLISEKENTKKCKSTLKPKSKNIFKPLPIISVCTSEQFEAVKSIPDIYIGLPLDLIPLIKDYDNKNILCLLPSIARNKDKSAINKALTEIKNNKGCGVICKNLEEYEIIKESGFDKIIIFDSSIYAFNKEAKTLINNLSDAFIAPLELSKHELKFLKNSDAYLNIYGRIPLMNTANCVVKTNEGCKKNKGNKFVYIKDRTNASLTVLRNCDFCFNTIYNSVPTFLIDEREFIKDFYHYLSFTDESGKETENILRLYFENSGKPLKNFTKAYFNRGVE